MRILRKVLILSAAVIIFAGLSGCSLHSHGKGKGKGKGPGMIKMKSNKGGTKIMVK
jgi:hypothetical protein